MARYAEKCKTRPRSARPQTCSFRVLRSPRCATEIFQGDNPVCPHLPLNRKRRQVIPLIKARAEVLSAHHRTKLEIDHCGSIVCDLHGVVPKRLVPGGGGWCMVSP